MTATRDDVEDILLSEQQIQRRLDELALELQRDFGDKDLTLIAVLAGSVMFVADLLRRLPMQLRLDYIGVSSYNGAQSSGELIFSKSPKLDVRDRDVLVVDDILDTGRTLVSVRDQLQAFGPRSVKFCVFLEKEIPHHQNFRADYIAFRIPNKFIVGYGLDYRERYRNLPFVATLKPAALAAPE